METPAQDTQHVAVYNFRMLERGYESAPVSPFKATRQAITEHFRGDLLEATEELVAMADLDREGRYRRMPTGWGELS